MVAMRRLRASRSSGGRGHTPGEGEDGQGAEAERGTDMKLKAFSPLDTAGYHLTVVGVRYDERPL